ncbi:PucR family transcriptional regulator [Cohnella boryungensis]|uniref:PucR family transcriptional regulator n=1 Tax=Cohnella boryungensis TaxID=768479 RepID=A0ABV8SC99_9BACL
MKTELEFTIGDLLQRPIFGTAALAGGSRGVHRKVGWVHVLEITNISPYVSSGDLILSTGIWIHRPEQERTDYLQQLIRSEAAGLCVELGTSIDRVPEELVAMAEEHDFPLIVFEKPVRFVEITQDIHALLINRHHQMLKTTELFSRRLQQHTQQSTDVAAVLRLLHEETSRQVFYISSIASNRFFPSLTGAAASRISEYYHREIEALFMDNRDEKYMYDMDESASLLVHPVVCFGQVFSAVGIVLPRDARAEFLSPLLDHTAKAIATLVLRTQFLEEKRLRNQNELIQQLLDNRLENEEQAQTSMGLRLLAKGHYLFASGSIEFEDKREESGPEGMEAARQDVLVLLRSLLKRHALANLVMIKGNQISLLAAKEAIVEESAASLLKTIRSIADELTRFAARQLPYVMLHAGFGKIRTRMTESWRSFHESYQVIEVKRIIPALSDALFYDELGAYRLLKAVPRQSILSEFIDDQLGALVAYDLLHGTQLVETLDVYLKCFGSKQDTAAKLFVHRQTLYARLEKLEELLGADYGSQHRRIGLELALMGHRMLGQ